MFVTWLFSSNNSYVLFEVCLFVCLFLLYLFVFIRLVHLPAQNEMKIKFILFLISKILSLNFFARLHLFSIMNFQLTWHVLKYLFSTWGHQSCSNTICERHIVMLFRFFFSEHCTHSNPSQLSLFLFLNKHLCISKLLLFHCKMMWTGCPWVKFCWQNSCVYNN